jgi:hypothetical protein
MRLMAAGAVTSADLAARHVSPHSGKPYSAKAIRQALAGAPEAVA